MSQHSTTIPAASPAAYAAARNGAGLLDRSDRGRIAVSGKDRASYLQGLLTNDVAALQPGQGCYAAYLTPQGRMITDLTVYALDDEILLSLGGDVKDAILARLDRLIFTEDVQLRDVTETMVPVTVAGPGAARLVAGVLPDAGDRLAALPENGNFRARFGSDAVLVVRLSDVGVPAFELLADRARAAALEEVFRREGALDVDAATGEVLRIEGGIPKFHRDMDERTIPLEAGIEARAISFSKGCYVGQEVIVRVLHRGHGRVAKKLVGLTIDGDEPVAPGSAVRANNNDVGEITSSVRSPALERPIALAYVQREFADAGTPVDVGGRAASVTALPFVP